MKNNGRKHKGNGTINCKGWLTGLTRDIHKMGSRFTNESEYSLKFMKKKWSKRVRGYFKSKTKNLLNDT